MVRILTDSSCDLPKAVAAQLGITVIPLYVTFEDGSIAKDGIDIDGDTFFERMRSCKKLPTTSQPSPENFMCPFLEAKEAGDEVVAILLSAQLSGTYQCAQIAANLAAFDDIHLVDSESLCVGLGVLVHLAARLRDEGKTATEIVTALNHAKKHLHIFAVVDNLEYLRKGGRLPTSAAIAGGLLGIKPIIGIENGKVCLAGKARGLPGAYLTLFKKIDALGGICVQEPYYAAYTLTSHELDPIQRYFVQNLNIDPPRFSRVGSTIGVHVGPGAFGFAFFDNHLYDALVD